MELGLCVMYTESAMISTVTLCIYARRKWPAPGVVIWSGRLYAAKIIGRYKAYDKWITQKMGSAASYCRLRRMDAHTWSCIEQTCCKSSSAIQRFNFLWVIII